MPLILFLLFICLPILELYVLWQVGDAIGILPTIGLLILDSLLGAFLMRSQGRAAWRNFNRAVSAGRIPAREVIDGALVIFGGALLLTPGFITDIFGIVFLLPPTRMIVRKVLVRVFAGRLIFAARAAGTVRRPRNFDVDGTATEVDPRHRELPGT